MAPSQSTISNRLIRALTAPAYGRIGPKLRRISFESRQVLYHPGQPIHEVYFPENTVICQMTVMENGDTLETATVGHEGASWISASVGAPSMPCETIVAIGGEAHALNIDDLDHEMQANEPFRDLLTKYSHALLIHSMRLTGCTGLHSLEQRCARWILTALDRVDEDQFSITHEFLAMLLGATRPSTSLVIEQFEKRGMLHIRRGRLVLGDRGGLERVSCACYQVIKRTYEQVGR